MTTIVAVAIFLLLGQGLTLAAWGTWWSAKNASKELRTIKGLALTYWRLLRWGLVPILGVILIGIIVYVNQAPQGWLEGENLSS
jgi:hypothetical protein